MNLETYLRATWERNRSKTFLCKYETSGKILKLMGIIDFSLKAIKYKNNFGIWCLYK